MYTRQCVLVILLALAALTVSLRPALAQQLSGQPFLVKEQAVSFPPEMVTVNDVLFSSETKRGVGRLWKSDGTEAGTVVVKEFWMGPNSIGGPENLTPVDGSLFFTMSDSRNFSGEELWKSDGSEAGTVIVKDLCPGSCSSSPWDLTNVNGTLFFWSEWWN
jgi:ELWxxDGT repeat protein